jgi:hypothetical protein
MPVHDLENKTLWGRGKKCLGTIEKLLPAFSQTNYGNMQCSKIYCGSYFFIVP